MVQKFYYVICTTQVGTIYSCYLRDFVIWKQLQYLEECNDFRVFGLFYLFKQHEQELR